MPKLTAKALETGEVVQFDIMDIAGTVPDDGVIYIRGDLGDIPLDANSVHCEMDEDNLAHAKEQVEAMLQRLKEIERGE